MFSLKRVPGQLGTRFLFTLILLGNCSFLSAASTSDLARSASWQKLLHVRKDILGRTRSEIDGENFFLSPRGRTDAEAELLATLDAFQKPFSPKSEDDEHPQCRFPARYVWLSEQHALLPGTTEQSCPRFEEWCKKINPSSVWLVFASYYLNNPASMYGHTFLRLGRKNYAEDEPLLDYTANFAAQTTSKNGIAFALKGLLGGYRGVYSTHPYYMKVQQYNNLESRDLWEYKLNFTQAETDQLLRHLWELGHTSFAYFFFNKNCSYQLLPLIEAARPSLNFSSRFQFRAIPLDTLRAVLADHDLISETRFRPSHLRDMIQKRTALTPSEQKTAVALVKNADKNEIAGKIPDNRKRQIFEAAYAYWRFRTGFARDLSESARENERNLLLLLNDLPIPSAPLPKKIALPTTAPESAHLTGRLSIGFGADRTTSFTQLTARGSLHDLNESPVGFVPGSQLEMMSTSLRYNDDRHRLSLDDFTLIDIKSISPFDPWVRAPSWRVHIGVNPAKDVGRFPDEHVTAGVNGGSGLSIGPLYAMMELDSAVGSVFENGYRLGAGGATGLFFTTQKIFHTHLNATALRYPVGNVGNRVRFSAVESMDVGRRWQGRVTLLRDNGHQEGLFSVNRYF